MRKKFLGFRAKEAVGGNYEGGEGAAAGFTGYGREEGPIA